MTIFSVSVHFASVTLKMVLQVAGNVLLTCMCIAALLGGVDICSLFYYVYNLP